MVRRSKNMNNSKSILLVIIGIGIMISLLTGCNKINDKDGEQSFRDNNIALFKENNRTFNAAKNDIVVFNEDVSIVLDQGGMKVKDINFKDVEINKELEEELNFLFVKCKIQETTYIKEDKIVQFYVETTIKPKGVIYISENDENKIREIQEYFDLTIRINDNWFYFEEYAGM